MYYVARYVTGSAPATALISSSDMSFLQLAVEAAVNVVEEEIELSRIEAGLASPSSSV
jgi:hypothetical protein